MKRRMKWSNSVRKNVSYVLRKMAYGFVLFLIPCPQIPSATQILIKICNFRKKKKKIAERRRSAYNDEANIMITRSPFFILHHANKPIKNEILATNHYKEPITRRRLL